MNSPPKDGTENIELETRAGEIPSGFRTSIHVPGSGTDGRAKKEPPAETHPKTGERERLEGFAAVEHEMMKHDEGTMEGHAKDVDTLLVFAGLFSAVLTAFAVESYQQLQVDTDQKSMFLLQRISIQLESFTLSPGFANCSTKPPLPSLDFVADVTARWINILWFLSLIFSLAAALFGILVKQWIREYMQWNSVLASPRENVLVRQIRFEAWNKWNVPATIAAVPALLETALILFVCGLVVLLWTLDAVISIVITTAVAVFLAAASTFIILPAFFVRCPYKSPTAWACAVIWDFITLWIPHTITRAVYWLLSGSWATEPTGRIRSWIWRKRKYVDRRIVVWKPFAPNWRQRDLAAVWTSPVTQTRRGDVAPLLQELLRLDQSPTDASAEVTEPQCDVFGASVWDYQRVPLHYAIRTITEFSPLVRALGWVSQASQDARTQQNVSRCAQMLESHFVLPDPIRIYGCKSPVTQDGVRALSIWYFISCASTDGVAALGLGDAGRSIAAIRRRAHDSCARPFNDIQGQWETDSRGVMPELHVLLHVLAPSIRTLVERLAKGPFDDSGDVQLIAQSAREQLGLIFRISIYQTENISPLQTAAHHLVEALRASDGDIRDSFESAFAGLRWDILRAAKELRNDDVSWSLLDELHVLVPPLVESDTLLQVRRFRHLSWYLGLLQLQGIRQRQCQTSLYARIYPPNPSSSPPAPTTLLFPALYATAELDDLSPRASSSSHGDAAGEGKQADFGHSKDSEAGIATSVDDMSILTKREDSAGEREDVGVGRPQEREMGSSATVPQLSSPISDAVSLDGQKDAVANDREGTSGAASPQDLMVAPTAAAPEHFVPIPDVSGNGDGGDEGEIQDADHLQDPKTVTTVEVPRQSSPQAGSGVSGLGRHGDAEGEIAAATHSSDRQESMADTPITASGADVPVSSDDGGGGNDEEGEGLVVKPLQDDETDSGAAEPHAGSTPRTDVSVLRGAEETSGDDAAAQNSLDRRPGLEVVAPRWTAMAAQDDSRLSGSSGHGGVAGEGENVDGEFTRDLEAGVTTFVSQQMSPGGDAHAGDGGGDAEGEDEDVGTDAGPSDAHESKLGTTATTPHRSPLDVDNPDPDSHESAGDDSKVGGADANVGRFGDLAADSTALQQSTGSDPSTTC